MDGLDPVIHAPVRLRIVATLAQLEAGDTLTFARMQKHLELTAGNLITHLRKLDEAGYTTSGRAGGTTTVALTDDGRSAFARYRTALAALLAPRDEYLNASTPPPVPG